MSDKELVIDIDPKLVDELEKVLRATAEMICDEQPDVPKPESLRDLDSFSVVQVLLELENSLEMKLLERLEGFEGEEFRDLAEFIARLAKEDEENKSDDAAGASPDKPEAAAATQDQPTPA